ncbi:MAG: hypothetical protein LKF30_04405 [Sphingobium sp.]|jgi:hypothetical protein|nr:hypothetical protein [Sphingobium sp.]MCI1271871.1 hypothetical protein [Sphingobium sp.]MCI1756428.1 hypothetical protein [Sphingobium sp.]MCI2051875.1 hypothetical protein [Sphingobium sp.]
MKRSTFIAALWATAVISLSSVANAQDTDARLKLGITAGTLGIGPEVSYRISERLGVRGNATFLSISRDIDSDDITYDGKVKLQSGGVMLDVYPFGGGFRVSGGLRINGNKARGIASPNSGTSYTINGTTYSATDIGTLRADTDIKNVAPALTLGYGGGLSNGLVFGVEAGALFQGSVKIKPLTITGVCAGASPPPTCATLTADLDAERRSVNDDIDGYKVYPILQLSVGYRF